MSTFAQGTFNNGIYLSSLSHVCRIDARPCVLKVLCRSQTQRGLKLLYHVCADFPKHARVGLATVMCANTCVLLRQVPDRG